MLAPDPPPGSLPLPGLVWGFRIAPDGRAEEIDAEAPVDAGGDDGFLWLHFNLADTRCNAFLKTLAFPPEAVEALVGPDTHQQLQAETGCVYGVIADLSRTFEGVTDDIALLHFAMTDRLLVSARRRPLNAVDAVRWTLRRGQKVSSTAALLELIVDQVAAAIDRLADDIALHMDRIEERILDGGRSDDRQSLGVFRRTTVRLHRQLTGLRVLFHRLEAQEPDELGPALALDSARLSQRLDGLDQEIEALRERARMLQDEISGQVAEETNRNLRVLSIVTILFLPPTLIAGFFGMNLPGMPYAENHAGFWDGVVVALLSSAAVYGLLRWLGLTGGRG
ncbi:Magnesium and cobalt transport protein CorA [Rhodovulum sp. PH10]|uniref:transporter n=1 Tax=Rhodovulum sp. PH10 TaxID=1187851 RepID=UPI00027C2233|nr:transporter [Rhodovulum sp. PH10]EJW10320.1 Magnesium and cobalt transport protein CorA [Rhodovulum sp. PH10]